MEELNRILQERMDKEKKDREEKEKEEMKKKGLSEPDKEALEFFEDYDFSDEEPKRLEHWEYIRISKSRPPSNGTNSLSDLVA